MKLNAKLKQLILKSIRLAALSGTLTMFSATALGAVANNALPTGPTVMGGNATTSISGAIMDVNQTSKNAAIKWDSFNVGANATVNFKYKDGFNGSYNILNYSTNGNKASEIFGHLHAGSGANVWIVNPNGVIIGQGAKIEAGALHVAAYNLTNTDFTTFTNNAPSLSTLGSYQPAELMSLGEIHADKITFDGGRVVLDADAMHKYNGSAANVINRDAVVLGATGNTTNGYLQVNHAEDGVVGYTANSFSSIKLNGIKDVGYAWVANLEQLQKIGENPITLSQKYALKNSIDATATASDVSFTPIGTNTNKFIGVLDGLGHDIYGLTINKPDADYVGLFGVIGDNAAIRNLNLIGGAIVGNSHVGGLVGYAKNSATIENVKNSARVFGVNNVGGIVGSVQGNSTANAVTLKDVENMALIRGNLNVGGITGSMINANITGTSSNNGTIKGIVNFKDDAQYAANKAKGAQALVDAKYKDVSGETTVPSKIQYEVSGCVFDMEYISTDNNGVMFGKVLSANLEHATNANAPTWAQNIVGKYGKIYKTGEGYYSFYTYLDIDTLFLLNGNTYHFTGVQQSAEILNGYANRNNTTFTEANGHEVGGLAGYAKNATIGNESLSQYQVHNDGLITGSGDLGGLVGLADGNVTIKNAANFGTVGDASHKAYGSNVGGLAGSLNGDIKVSYNQGSIYNGLDNTGGLVGSMKGGSLTEVFNAGDISVEMQKDAEATNVGGLVGDLRNGTIKSAYNVGKINSFVNSNFTGYNRVAGIVGTVKNFTGTNDWTTIYGVYTTTEILAKKGNVKQNHGDDKADLHPILAIAGNENRKLTGYGYFIYPEDYTYNKGTTAYNNNYAANGKYSSLSTYLNSHSNTDGTHGILYSERFLLDNVSVFRGLQIGSNINPSNFNVTDKTYAAMTANPTFAGTWRMYWYDKATGQTLKKGTDGKYYNGNDEEVTAENIVGTLPMLNAFEPSNKGSLTDTNIKYVQYGTEENPLATFVTLKDGSVTTYYPEGGLTTTGVNNAKKVLIESTEQLKNELANNGLSKSYVLVNDINAAEITGAFSSGTFTGTLDGNGHSIYGLSDSLFAANSGTIQNLILKGAYITAAPEGFGLLAKTNNGIIDHVTTLGNTIQAAGNNVGGLVGTNNGTITNASIEDIIYANGHSNIGAIAAINSQAINNIMAQTALTSAGTAANLGAIAGSNTGTVAYIANYGPMNLSSGNSIGGIIGTNKDAGTLKDSLNYGSLTVKTGQNIGGIVGSNVSLAAQALDNLENYAAIIAPQASSVGGIMGANSGNLENVTLINHSSAAVTGSDKVGGIAGTNSGTLSGGRDENNNYYKYEIYNNAPVVAGEAGNAGGIAGLNSGNINLAYNTGAIIGKTTGGVMGYDSTQIFTNSFSSANSSTTIHEALFKTSLKFVLDNGKSLSKVYDGTGEAFNLKVETDGEGLKHAYVYKGSEKLGELQAVDPKGKHTLQDFFDSYSEAQGAVNLLSSKNTAKDAGTYNVLTSMQIVGDNHLGFCLGTPTATLETNDFLTYNINKKQLTTSANTVERTYGNANITGGKYGFTLSGFVSADGSASRTVDLAATSVEDNAIKDLSDGQATKNAGDYSWTVGYSLDAAASKNYTLGADSTNIATATILGSSKVNKADLTIQLKDVVMSYSASQAGAISYTDATDSHKDHVLKSGVASTYGFTVAGTVNGDDADTLHGGINIAAANYVNSGFNPDGTTKDVVYGDDNQPTYAYRLTLANPSNITATTAVSQNYNLHYSNTANSGKVMITPAVLTANGSTVYRTYGDATVYFDPQSVASRAPIGSSANPPDLGQIQGWLNDDDKSLLYQCVYLDQDEHGFENVKDGAVLDANGNKYTDGRQTSDVGTYKWTEGTWKMETGLLKSDLNNYRLYDGSQYVTELGAGGDSIVEKASLTLQLNNLETSYGTAFNTTAANSYGYTIKELENGKTINGIDSLTSIKAALGIQNSSYANAYDHKEGVANSVTGNAGTYNQALGLKADGYKDLGNYIITVNKGNIIIKPVDLKLVLNDVMMQYAALEGVKDSSSLLNEAGVATTNIANQYGLKSVSLVNGDSLASVLGTISYHNSGFNSDGTTKNVTYDAKGQPIQTQWQEDGVTKYAELTASFTQSDTTNYKVATVTTGKVTITPAILEAKGSTVYYTYGDPSKYYFAGKHTANREDITPANFQDQAISGWLGTDGDKKATVGGTEKELRLWVAVEIKDNVEDVDDHALTADRKGTKEVGQYTWSNGSMTMETSLTNDPEALGNYRFWKLSDGDTAGYYATSKPVEGISIVEKADLTININSQAKTYGDVLEAYGFTVQGGDLAAGNDTITRAGETSNTELMQTLSSYVGGYNDHGAKATSAGKNTGNAGSYVLEFNNNLVNQGLLHNYDIKVVNNGTITINKANLSLTVNDVVMRYASSEGIAGATSLTDEAGVAYTNIANQYGIKGNFVNGDSIQSVLGAISYKNTGFNSNGTTNNVTYGANGQPLAAHSLTASYTPTSLADNYNISVTPGKVTITPVVLDVKGSTVYRDYGNPTYYFAPHDVPNRENIPEGDLQDNKLTGWLNESDEYHLSDYVSMNIGQGAEGIVDHALNEDGTGTKEPGVYAWYNGYVNMNPHFTDSILANYRFWQLPDGDIAGQYATEKHVGGASIVEAVGPIPQPEPDLGIQSVVVKDIYPWLSEAAHNYNYVLASKLGINDYSITIINGGMYFFEDMLNPTDKAQAAESEK